jgi:hypothetical protein
MSGRVTPALLMFGCVFSLNAQITTTLTRAKDGVDEVGIQNHSQAALIAYVVSAKPSPDSVEISRAPVVTYSDPLVDPAAKPLLVGEERIAIRIGILDRSGKPRAPHFLVDPSAAGIFADGTTTGDAALLTRMILRRSNMLLAVENSLEALSNAGRHSVPKAQLVEQFKRMADLLDHGYLPSEQRIGRRLYQSIIEKLNGLQEGPLGTPFPPTTFVEAESAPLRRQRVRCSNRSRVFWIRFPAKKGSRLNARSKQIHLQRASNTSSATLIQSWRPT